MQRKNRPFQNFNNEHHFSETVTRTAFGPREAHQNSNNAPSECRQVVSLENVLVDWLKITLLFLTSVVFKKVQGKKRNEK